MHAEFEKKNVFHVPGYNLCGATNSSTFCYYMYPSMQYYPTWYRRGTGRLNPSRETKFSGTHGDRGIFIFPVQLTTSRIGNLTRLIHTLLYVMTIHTSLIPPREDQCEWHRMTRMTGPDCVVMCNLINTYIHTRYCSLYIILCILYYSTPSRQDLNYLYNISINRAAGPAKELLVF